MHVTPEYLIVLALILFGLYRFQVFETFQQITVPTVLTKSKCNDSELKLAYKSSVFKPRRPEHQTCTTEKDAEGTEKTTCKNKTYTDDQIRDIFKIYGVSDDCILELVKTWGW